MQENVIIDFSTDMSKLTSAIDALEKMGAVTVEQANAAKKAATEYKAQQDAIATGMRSSSSEVEKFAESYKNLVSKITGGAINNTFKDIVAAMQTVNPEASKLFAGFNDVKDAEAFLAQASGTLKQQLAQLAAEGKEGTDEYKNLSVAIEKLGQEMQELSSMPKPDVSPDGQSEKKIVSARTRLKELREEMMRMEDAGQVDSDAFRKLAEEAGALTDQLGDTQDIVNYLASDTKGLDALSTGAQGVVGAFNAGISTMALFGGESEKLQEAFYKVQAAMAAVNGVMAVANALNKTSPLIRGIVYMQTLAAAKATNLQTAATGKATIAQRLFNLVAKANPYVLLAVAIITVVGALAAFISSTKSAAEKQKELNEAQEKELEILELRAKSINRSGKERMDAVQHEINIAKTLGLSEEELIALERKKLEAQRKTYEENKKNAQKEFGFLNENIAKLREYEETLAKIKNSFAQGFKGKISLGDGTTADIEDAIDVFQGKIDNMGKSVEIGMSIVTDSRTLAEAEAELNGRAKKLAEEQNKKRIELAKQASKEELAISRQARDSQIKLIEDEKARREAEVNENFARQKNDLEKRRDELKRDGLLTVKANAAINETLKNQETLRQQKLTEIDREFAKKRLDEKRRDEDLEISLMEDGFDKQKKLIETEYNRQIEDLQTRLDNEASLSDEEYDRMYDRMISLSKKREKEIGQIVLDEKMKNLDKVRQERLDTLDNLYNDELTELAEMYGQGLIKEKDYNLRREQMQHDHATNSAGIEIDSINEQLQSVEAGSDKEKELLQQLSDARKQLAKENADYEIAEAERSAEARLEKEQALKDALKELQSAAFDMANELSQMFFDNEKARLDQQLADLDKFYTTDAEEAAKNRNLKLVSEEELARKEAEIKNKQAAAEKQAAYIQAVINAAKAITQVFATTPPPASFILAGITAAATAIQIAKIASSPVPKYAKGRKGGRGEYALTGELGPEIVWLPDGASVIPAHKSKKLLEGMRIAGEYKIPLPASLSFSNADVSDLRNAQYDYSIDYDKLGHAIAKNVPSIPEIKQLNVSMDENGFSKFLTGKTGRTVFLNSRG
jgi:hypothetical protein